MPEMRNPCASKPSEATHHPQSGSPLLQLPRELRDKIYDYLFGNPARQFFHRDIAISAITDTSHYSWPILGLPHWLLTCRQISTEAMDLFARTRTFEYTDLCTGMCVTFECDCDFMYIGKQPVAQSLVFSNDRSVQRIALRPTMALNSMVPLQFRRAHIPETTAFLQVVSDLDAHDLQLKMEWDRAWHGPYSGYRLERTREWVRDEERVFDFLESDWDGRMRRVEIVLVYHEKSTLR